MGTRQNREDVAPHDAVDVRIGTTRVLCNRTSGQTPTHRSESSPASVIAGSRLLCSPSVCGFTQPLTSGHPPPRRWAATRRGGAGAGYLPVGSARDEMHPALPVWDASIRQSSSPTLPCLYVYILCRPQS